MNNPIMFPRALKQFFGLTPKFFDLDPGSGMEKFRIRDGEIRIRDKNPRSATLVAAKFLFLDFLKKTYFFSQIGREIVK